MQYQPNWERLCRFRLLEEGVSAVIEKAATASGAQYTRIDSHWTVHQFSLAPYAGRNTAPSSKSYGINSSNGSNGTATAAAAPISLHVSKLASS